MILTGTAGMSPASGAMIRLEELLTTAQLLSDIALHWVLDYSMLVGV